MKVLAIKEFLMLEGRVCLITEKYIYASPLFQREDPDAYWRLGEQIASDLKGVYDLEGFEELAAKFAFKGGSKQAASLKRQPHAGMIDFHSGGFALDKGTSYNLIFKNIGSKPVTFLQNLKGDESIVKPGEVAVFSLGERTV